MYFSNFFKEIRSNFSITSINIIGYSISLATCLIIGIYVYNQTKWDKFNSNYKKIYRINYLQNDKNINSGITNHHLKEVLPADLPGITKAAKFAWNWDSNIEYRNNNHKDNGAYGDIELFDVFSFRVLEQTSKNFFEQPHSIALSKSLAVKIFGQKSPLGETLTLDYNKKVTVSAVFADIPENSSVRFNFLLNSNDLLNEYGDGMKHHWLWWMWRTFVVVDNEKVASEFGKSMKPLQKKYIGDWNAEAVDYYLQPMEAIHMQSAAIDGGFENDVSKTMVYVICSAGLLILIISCINFINLSIAGFETRKKSVAIKKIIGASSSYLFKQYLYYSIFLTFLCILIAIFIAQIVLPFIKSQGIIGVYIPFANPYFWVAIFTFGLVIGVFSGIYPAKYISSTVAVSKQSFISSRLFFRNGLITFQFAIAIILLIAVLVIKKQIHISTKGSLGYNYSSLISFSGTGNTYNHFEAMQSEIKKVPGVIAVTSCSFQLPGYMTNFNPVQLIGTDIKTEVFHTSVSPNFFEVLNISVINKQKEFAEDTSSSNNAVLNCEAVRRFGIGESVVGKSYFLGKKTKVEVVGIVSDFNYGSLRDAIRPIQFTIENKGWNNIVRIDGRNNEKTIKDIGKIWKKFELTQPFEYYYVSELIEKQYKSENALLKLFNVFCALAIIISLIGLYGLINLLLSLRVKEIGVRRVNGAKVFEILKMLNQDFIIWIAIAFIIACPVAWYAMNTWLQNFAYRTELNWWIFAFAGLLTLFIALITVSWQAWRAATRNPVESLRSE